MEGKEDGVWGAGAAGSQQLRAGCGDSAFEAATGAAARAGDWEKLRTAGGEYFSCGGWEFASAENKVAWDLRIAFEHENHGGRWFEELCKLCHVVADLRVLVSYFYKNVNDVENHLQNTLSIMGQRLSRVPKCEWLVAFGPSTSILAPEPFLAFSLDVNGVPRRIIDDRPLVPRVDFGCNSAQNPVADYRSATSV